MFFFALPSIVFVVGFVLHVFHLGLGTHNLMFANSWIEEAIYHFNNEIWFYVQEFVSKNFGSLFSLIFSYLSICFFSYIFFELIFYFILKIMFIFLSEKNEFTYEGVYENKMRQFKDKNYSDVEMKKIVDGSFKWIELVRKY